MQKRRPIRAVFFGVLSAAWIGVLFFFSGQTGAESGSLSQWIVQHFFARLLSRGMDALLLEHYVRKAAHFAVFAAEGFFLGMTLMSLMKKRFAFPAVLLGSAAVAVLNELHQRLSDGRSCQVSDMVIDFSGAVLGLLVAVVFIWLLNRLQDKRTERITTGDLT